MDTRLKRLYNNKTIVSFDSQTMLNAFTLKEPARTPLRSQLYACDRKIQWIAFLKDSNDQRQLSAKRLFLATCQARG